jgi:aldehyde:ferredoxin oxidoreductase
MRFTVATQRLYAAMDSLTICQFVFGPSWQLYGPDDIVELVRSVTGWEDFTYADIEKVGERRINMMRAFNAREGFDRKDDLVPEKLFKPLKGGASDGWKLDKDEVEGALDTYFELSGWDVKSGNPTSEKLKELGLSWIVN